MPWFKVDDSFYDHPKVFDAPDCAVALWTRAGSWSARNLTNGYVPAAMLARFCSDPETAAAELVRRRLWSRSRGGYKFHDWDHYQPTKEAVENERKAARDRMRKIRKARSQTDSFARTSTELQPNFARSSAAPTQPIPAPINGSVGSGTERGLSTATRKPDFSHNNPNPNGTATRQPPPVADAIAAALNPDGRTGRHARQENPR